MHVAAGLGPLHPVIRGRLDVLDGHDVALQVLCVGLQDDSVGDALGLVLVLLDRDQETDLLGHRFAGIIPFHGYLRFLGALGGAPGVRHVCSGGRT